MTATALAMKGIHLNPAEYVIHIFKGVRKAARQIGCDPSAVSRWRTAKDREGFEGSIPACAQRVIIRKALELKLDITSLDLDFGRTVFGYSE